MSKELHKQKVDATIKERALKIYPVRLVDVPDIDEGCPSWIQEDENASARAYYIKGASEQKAIDDKRTKELLQYLEELEAHYRKLGQYDDGKPIRRVIEYIKSLEKYGNN